MFYHLIVECPYVIWVIVLAFDKTPKSDNTQKQETKQNTDEQKAVDNTQKVSTKKNVKKHAKKSIKNGVKKTPAKKATTSATAPVAPAKKQAPVSDAKGHKVVSTNATVNTQETKNSEKKLPQTGNKTNYALITLGLASLVTSLSLVGAKKRKHN